jgi:hypothetical protein
MENTTEIKPMATPPYTYENEKIFREWAANEGISVAAGEREVFWPGYKKDVTELFQWQAHDFRKFLTENLQRRVFDGPKTGGCFGAPYILITGWAPSEIHAFDDMLWLIQSRLLENYQVAIRIAECEKRTSFIWNGETRYRTYLRLAWNKDTPK